MQLVVGGTRYRAGRRLARRLALLALVAALGAFGSAVRQAMAVRQQIHALQEQIEQQRRQNTELERALRDATSPRSIEQRARETMGLVRPGERVIEPALPVPADDPFRVPRRPPRPGLPIGG